MKAQDVTVGTVVAFPHGADTVVKTKTKGAHVVLYSAAGGKPLVVYGKATVAA